jgi:type III restriction enzyme
MRLLLEILAKIAAEVMSEDPGEFEAKALLDQIKAHVQQPDYLTDFERNFPSLCFALATGVGKTRLMGACIAYLHAVHGIRHFMVLAPNLTIYNKLIDDFSEGSATPKLDDKLNKKSKYVFKGLAQYATCKPVIITGDNYESGMGAKDDLLGERIFINIFNISKFSTKDGRKFHKLSECIGESYFEYLSNLPDLVLLMDEAHRYRATAAMETLNELKPRLGIELTATPQVEKGSKTQVFKNIVYQYNLSNAMRDGYVKEPVCWFSGMDRLGATVQMIVRRDVSDGRMQAF